MQKWLILFCSVWVQKPSFFVMKKKMFFKISLFEPAGIKLVISCWRQRETTLMISVSLSCLSVQSHIVTNSTSLFPLQLTFQQRTWMLLNTGLFTALFFVIFILAPTFFILNVNLTSWDYFIQKLHFNPMTTINYNWFVEILLMQLF